VDHILPSVKKQGKRDEDGHAGMCKTGALPSGSGKIGKNAEGRGEEVKRRWLQVSDLGLSQGKTLIFVSS